MQSPNRHRAASSESIPIPVAENSIVLGVPHESARVQILSSLLEKRKVERNLDILKVARATTPGFSRADLDVIINKAGMIAFDRILLKRKENMGENQSSDWDWLKSPLSPQELELEESCIITADILEAAKTVRPSWLSDTPDVSFDDVGGMQELKQEFDRYIIRRIKDPEKFGIGPIGFLLFGPPGCGKTLLAKAVAREAGANFIHLKGSQFLSGFAGKSWELAARTLESIFSSALTYSPCIILIDEVDALTTRELGSVGDHLLSKLLNFFDEVESKSSRGVYVIGTTNRPEVMDNAVRRSGRFGKVLHVPLPTPEERGLILKTLARNKPVDAGVDLMAIGKDLCKNFSGADLYRLMNEAAAAADDDEEAAKTVRPPWFADTPDVSFDDVGGMQELKQQFDRYIISPIKDPKDPEKVGIDLPTGFVLYGPTGCGKTLLAKAVAREAGANFIHFQGSQFLSGFAGERGELAAPTLESIFRSAQTNSPCIILIDEVDALTTRELGLVGDQLLSKFFNYFDEVESKGSRGVYVIGTTNRLEVMDSAVLRSGRFGKVLHVPLPTPEERGLILKTLARNKPVDAGLDLMALGKDRCKNFSGADLCRLMNAAAAAAEHRNSK